MRLVAPPPLVVFGIGIVVTAVNLASLMPLPAGADVAAYLVGYLLTPLVIAVLYWVWYRRRHPPGISGPPGTSGPSAPSDQP